MLRLQAISTTSGRHSRMSVWKQLQGFSDKNLVHAGVNGDRLRIERNRADYEADLKNVANMTMPALFKSKAVLKYLR